MKIKGIVEKGLGLGKSEFVPTLNLMLGEEPVGLEFGVYVCRVLIEGEVYGGVMHYGIRSSVDNLITFEVNVFEFEKQIYGEEVEVEVLDKLREIVKFDSFEELKVQILKDVNSAKKILEI